MKKVMMTLGLFATLLVSSLSLFAADGGCCKDGCCKDEGNGACCHK